MSDFKNASRVEPIADGEYGVTIDPDWYAGFGPNGGYLAGIMLRALVTHVDDPARHPLSLTCHYLGSPETGDAVVAVTTERAGRGVTALSARMEQNGRTCILALATLGVEREGAIDFASQAPSVYGPDDLGAPALPGWTPPIFHQLDYRPCLGPPQLSGSDDATVGGWTRLKNRGELDEPALAMFADAWPPAAWGRLTEPAVAPTIDMTFHFRARIPADAEWVLVRMRSSTSRHGFFEEDGEIWTPDGTLLAQSRQLALLRKTAL